MNRIEAESASEDEPGGFGAGSRDIPRLVARISLYLALLSPLLVPPSLVYPSTVFPAVFFRWTVAVATTALIWQISVRRRVELTRDPVFLSLLIFLAVSTGAALLGYAPTRSLYGGLSRMGGVISLLYGVLYYASVRTFITGSEMRRYLTAAFLVGLAIALVAVVQSTAPMQRLLWIPNPPGNPAGTLPNSGLLGGYLLVVLGIGAWLATKQRTLSGSVLIGGALLLVLYAFMLPDNRASFLGLLAAVSLGALVVALRVSLPSVRLAVLGVIGSLAAMLVITFVMPANPLTQAVAPLRSLAGMSLRHPTLVIRFDYWKSVLNGFSSAPWLGAGPENFGLVFTRFHSGDVFESLPSGYEDRAHNVLLETLATTGTVGLVAYLAIWVAIGLGLLRSYRKRTSGFAEMIVLGCLGVAFLLYLQMWFHELTASIPLLALAALISQRAAPEAAEAPPGSESRQTSRKVLVLLGALTLAIFTWQHTVPVVRGAMVLAGTVMAPTFEEAARTIAATDAQRIPETMELATIDATALLDLTREIGSIRSHPDRLETVQSAIADADAQLEQLNRIDPRNDRWLIERGDIYVFAAQLTGDVEYVQLAMEYYGRAAELSPRRLTPLYKIAAARLLLGDRTGAFATTEDAKRIDPGEGRPYAFEARLHLATTDLEPALDALREAWSRDYCDTRAEMDEILQRARDEERWQSAAAILREYYSMPCSDMVRPPAEVDLDRKLRMELPLLLLRAGDDAGAIRRAEELATEQLWSEEMVLRFSEDVERGWSSAWTRHATLEGAARELATGPLDHPLAR